MERTRSLISSLALYLIYRPATNHNQSAYEASLLREEAIVIAMSEANTDMETLETLADPDRIVRAGFDEMIDKVIEAVCTPKTMLPTFCEYVHI